MNLAQKIKQAREKAGKTQAEVAGLMEISQQAYSQYESGRRVPKPETISRIAYALGTTPEEFLVSLFMNDASSTDLETFDSGAEFDKHWKDILPGGDSLTVIHTTDSYKAIAFALDQLNEEGKKKAVERVAELTEIPRYRADEYREPADTSDDKDPAGE